jgi:protein TonB
MTDPVSEELQRRMSEPVPWRSALVAALLIHGAVAAAVVLGPSGGHRALSLPRIQVRIAPALPSSASESAGGQPKPAQVETPKPAMKSPPSAKSTKPAGETARKAELPRRSSPPPARVPATPQPRRTGAQGGEDAGGPATSAGASAAIGLGDGAGKGGTDEAFPYGYYLNRLLAMIESNWFRPPAPPETRTRVLCRIDRTGRVLEVGLEEPSSSSAFDRAALRAVYAAAPFPPLPQGFHGSTLTLHLEFGQQ